MSEIFVVYGHPDPEERDSITLTSPENITAIAMALDEGHIALYSIRAQDWESCVKIHESILYGE